jgi:ABC-type phosphate transport system substrate-binding protein
MISRTRPLAAAGAFGLAASLLAAAPAQADPTGTPTYRQLSAEGSDDAGPLLDALSNSITISGSKVLGYYDNTYQSGGSTTIQTQTASACDIDRVDGGLTGFGSMLYSNYQSNGCLQFASTFSIATGNYTDFPSMTYIPYAYDAIAYAVTNNSTVPRELTLAQLQGIYTCNPTYVGTGPDWTITPLLPQGGSSIRAYWEQLMGINDSQVLSNDFPCISDESGGSVIQDGEGEALSQSSLMPYSVATYDEQEGEMIGDVQGDAVLGWIAPSAGDSPIAPFIQNPQFPSAANGITYAVSSNSSLPRDLTIAELQQIYQCNSAYVGTGPDYAYTPLLPESGSSIRSSWETTMGITDAEVTSGELPCISDEFDGSPIPDSNGEVLSQNSLIPFSISAYDNEEGQVTGDLRGDALLGALGTALPWSVNIDYPGENEVYNVVPTSVVDTSPYTTVFDGSDSLICESSALIEQYGFTTTPDCGETDETVSVG